jgi:antitoxin component HigA of HigAB toxin-antitoxin module
MATVHEAAQRFGLRALAKTARISRTLLAEAIRSKAALPDRVIAKLGDAVIKLDQKALIYENRKAKLIAALRALMPKIGIRRLATIIGIDHGHLSRVLAGYRPMTVALIRQIDQALDRINEPQAPEKLTGLEP